MLVNTRFYWLRIGFKVYCDPPLMLIFQPVAGLNVVLLSGRGNAASGGGCAKSLKQIVGRAVFLKDHDYILESSDLGVIERDPEGNQPVPIDTWLLS